MSESDEEKAKPEPCALVFHVERGIESQDRSCEGVPVKLFVTGTDTGVGKTFVTSAIARRARELGRSVFAFKPIETGCVGEGPDQTELCAAAGGWQTGELRGLYTFPLPAAPLAAARGTAIDLEKILRTSTSQAADVVLVEGAGGWRVPITETADMAELAVELGFPVLIVARATLGTINHSLLTAEAVESSGCRIAALVLSQHPEDDGDFAASNLALIRSRWSGLSFLFTGELSELDPLLEQT